MEIPITGLLYHSMDSGSEHAHSLLITSWDGRPVSVHVHAISGDTSYDVGHYHRYSGFTDPAPSGVPHIHYYNVETSFNDQHIHYVRGQTGPAIPIPGGGGHYHEFEGFTTINGKIPHSHRYKGNTGRDR
ncbi:YmaF family protein [Paenibacillus puldeungensis]|uniref:YmaF family protein n=1 Tax=Paenibacillus puldeungensis TaxID=696536 RepID=A0ABW3RUV1_9BACL